MSGANKYPTLRLHSALYERLVEPYGASANISISRYFWLLDSALPEFSELEWSLMRDACNGWATSLESPDLLVQGLRLQIEDSIELESLDKKWGVDGNALLKRMELLNPVETLAVIHSIEKWWTVS